MSEQLKIWHGSGCTDTCLQIMRDYTGWWECVRPFPLLESGRMADAIVTWDPSTLHSDFRTWL